MWYPDGLKGIFFFFPLLHLFMHTSCVSPEPLSLSEFMTLFGHLCRAPNWQPWYKGKPTLDLHVRDRPFCRRKNVWTFAWSWISSCCSCSLKNSFSRFLSPIFFCFQEFFWTPSWPPSLLPFCCFFSANERTLCANFFELCFFKTRPTNLQKRSLVEEKFSLDYALETNTFGLWGRVVLAFRLAFRLTPRPRNQQCMKWPEISGSRMEEI